MGAWDTVISERNKYYKLVEKLSCEREQPPVTKQFPVKGNYILANEIISLT